MSFDAFCYSTTDSDKIPGETQDEIYKAKSAFEVLSFELGAENTINIGSISGGGGAGKATFKEFTITKKTDTASTGLFHALCTGKHFTNLTIELRRSGAEDTKSGGVFMKFEMSLVMVQDISWSGSDGDDICEETVILQYGAIKIQYQPQDAKGKMGTAKEAMWNRVKNNNTSVVD
ncbi:Hcp family type VI secretion system effector [Albidovulum sediminis]|uniref:Type VI secretion system tube protein Hcp n=1 Tax=Albidovulum sediminis TaxID=3066345 RepID=A0ABT2NMY2_9RHOB|nr:type VI secretion system tube protein Hcp [Defluviimonas sediminis]MCT8329458.1 type VI secretion system tube protein Hcp [Defluviimonas sediminis]